MKNQKQELEQLYPGCLDISQPLGDYTSDDETDGQRLAEIATEWKQFTNNISSTIQRLVKRKAVEEMFAQQEKLTYDVK